MPDRDTIQKEVSGLPQIKDPGIEGGTPPEDGLAWKFEEYDAYSWVTKEKKFSKEYVVLRTTGDRRGTTLVERDFVNVLGRPAQRSSEMCHPPVYSTTWNAQEAFFQINRGKPS
jgi:hypothetical protein